MNAVMPNPMEFFLLTLLGGGFGLPSATPPSPEDPLTQKVAPAECLFYASWAGTAKPDANSTNRTERLLAEPEIQNFLANSGGAMGMFEQQIAAGNDEGAKELFRTLGPLVKAIQTKPGAVYVSNFQYQQGAAPVLQAGVIARLGNDAPNIKAALDQLLAQVPDVQTSPVQVGTRTFTRLQSPGAPPLTYGLAGPYLLAGIGDGELQGMMQRARGQIPPWLAEIHAKLPVDRRATVGYVNIQRFVQTLSPPGSSSSNIVTALGVDKIKALMSVTGMDATGTVSRTLLTVDGPPSGALAWLDMSPLTAEDLAVVPRNSPAAVVIRMDAGKVYDAVIGLMAQIDPKISQDVTQGLAGAEGQFGLKVREDLLASLGSTWRIYAHPGPNGLMTGWTISIDLRDAAKFKQIHAQLLVSGRQMLQAFGGPPISEEESEGQTVYAVNMGIPGVPSPSWSLTDDQLVISLNQLAVNAAISGKNRASLATVPEVQALLDGAPTLQVISIDMKRVLQVIMPLMEMAAAAQPGAINTDTSHLPDPATIAQHLGPTVAAVQRTQDGVELISRQTLPTANVAATTPLALALAVPAVQAARESARRMESQNKLKTISLALYNYSVKYKTLPPAYTATEDGKPLLSWRVHILPFIGRDDLYKQFKFTEPWDSPTNMALIPQMPDIFAAPGSEAGPGQTVYLGIGGADGIFGPPPGALIGTAFKDVTDGTANTILVVEANDASAVAWTQPTDFDPTAGEVMARLVGLRPKGFQALFCDGSVKFVAASVDAQNLQGMFTKAGGEAVTAP